MVFSLADSLSRKFFLIVIQDRERKSIRGMRSMNPERLFEP